MSDLSLISKTLSYILRHSDIEKDKKGYVDINMILNNPKLKKYGITFETIKYIVDNDKKNRYKLSDDNKLIRANQGHSKQYSLEIGDEIDSNIMFAYHGTSIKNSKKIMINGLSRMNRSHIHMVENKKNVLHYSEIIIQIDIKKAQELGIKFIKSENNYILSTGDKDNIIPPECLSIVPV